MVTFCTMVSQPGRQNKLMQSLPLLLIRRTRLGSAKVTEGVVERRLKRREMEEGDGEARGARPRPAPEESTMERRER